MPYIDESFDHVICIAVIHHLNSTSRRIKVIAEIGRVLKPKGTALISAWELDLTDKVRKQKDGLIGWTDVTHDKVYMRYYHLFEKNELESLVASVKGIRITESFWEHNNFYIKVCKT